MVRYWDDLLTLDTNVWSPTVSPNVWLSFIGVWWSVFTFDFIYRCDLLLDLLMFKWLVMEFVDDNSQSIFHLLLWYCVIDFLDWWLHVLVCCAVCCHLISFRCVYVYHVDYSYLFKHLFFFLQFSTYDNFDLKQTVPTLNILNPPSRLFLLLLLSTQLCTFHGHVFPCLHS